MGTVTHQEYDAAGRRIAVVENYQEGGPLAADVNRTTNFEYNLDGNLTKQTAVNAGTGNQETVWTYGVAIGGGESDLASKGLVAKKTYPDGGEVTFTYNRAGQVTTMTDQNGTVHAYGYDEFGRLTSDEASIAEGSAIDLSVKKITRTYEVRGMLAKVSSLDDGDGVVNEVLFVYNDFSQLYRDYQAHAGAVNTSTTLRVQYGYADGSDNTIRPLAIIYPNSTVYHWSYGDTGSAADALSRPQAVTDSTDVLCRYRYLGLGTNVGVIYDNAAGVELTYENGGSGDAGDKYTGLDRFGRLVETIWQVADDSVPPVLTTLVHSTYGRNRFGGVVWRYDELAHAQSPSPVTDQDNFYTYDGLYQVKQHQRGDLGGGGPPYTGITSPDQQEDWTYDPTGNWNAYHNVAGMLDNQQTRAHNAANEITEITAPSPIGSVNPVYDLAGNMTTMPTEPGVSTDTTPLVWDAWNRLVSYTTESPFAMEYQYDGLTRRTLKINTATADERHFYYNRQWRPVEEWLDNSVEISYIWGLRDRWDLAGANLISTFRACLRDYLDPVALADASGEVQERMGYDAFGNVRYMDADFEVRSPFATGWAFFFHGEFLDGESGLYNYGYRYYFSSLGLWPNRDPIGELGFLSTQLFSEPLEDFQDGSVIAIAESALREAKSQAGNIEAAIATKNNLYRFLNNNSISQIDFLGFEIFEIDYVAFEGNGPTTPGITGASPQLHLVNPTSPIISAIHQAGVIAAMLSAKNPSKDRIPVQYEYCGYICCDGAGRFSVTRPTTEGRTNTCSPTIACPEGSKEVGFYHNHPLGTELSSADYTVSEIQHLIMGATTVTKQASAGVGKKSKPLTRCDTQIYKPTRAIKQIKDIPVPFHGFQGGQWSTWTTYISN